MIKYVVFGIMLSITLSAQQLSPKVLNTSGGNYTQTNARLRFNIGEAVTTRLTASGQKLTQGFLQPQSNSISVPEINSKDQITVYPNPVHEVLTIQHKGDHQPVYLTLVDVIGKEVLRVEYKENQLIAIQNLEAGIYYVVFYDAQSQISHREKIIKTN